MKSLAKKRAMHYNDGGVARELNRAATLGNQRGVDQGLEADYATSVQKSNARVAAAAAAPAPVPRAMPQSTVANAPTQHETAVANREELKKVANYNKGGMVKKPMGMRGAC